MAYTWLTGAKKPVTGLRVSAETELKGLDIPEMGSLGYNPDAEYYTPDVPEIAAAGVLTY